MTSDELLPQDVPGGTAGGGAEEDLRLLRRYEPVLRFTEGELFLPMPVEAYLEKCSLWRTGPRYERDGSVRLSWSDPVGWAGLDKEDPHAHLRHRALPNVDPARTRTRVLRIWSAVSATVLLTGLALVILGQFGALVPAVGGLPAARISGR